MVVGDQLGVALIAPTYGYLKLPSFNVNHHYLAMIALLDLSACLRFINLIATLCKFFFAVAGLSNCHRLNLIAT